MNQRDYFAAAALTALMANPEHNKTIPELMCFWAWNWADSMLRERERTNHDAEPAARAPEPEAMRAGPPHPQGCTGDTLEPVAWAVFCGNSRYCYDHYDDECEARAIAGMMAGDDRGDGLWRVVPLYRSPALTDEERKALHAVVCGSDVLKWQEIEAVVRRLLDRTK